MSWVPRAVQTAGSDRRALILLNTPLDAPLVSLVWNSASMTVCADGAADRLLSALPHLVPQLIVGDLDSATDAALAHYRRLGSEVIDLGSDQDSTDLDKALVAAAARGCNSAVVIGRYSGSAGRLDHTFGIVQSMFLSQVPHGPFEKVIILSHDAELQLLLPTAEAPHCIETMVGAKVGLIPISGPCNDVTTTGLKWDLDHARLGFGGLISTSNVALNEQATVASDGPLLWTQCFPDAPPGK